MEQLVEMGEEIVIHLQVQLHQLEVDVQQVVNVQILVIILFHHIVNRMGSVTVSQQIIMQMGMPALEHSQMQCLFVEV